MKIEQYWVMVLQFEGGDQMVYGVFTSCEALDRCLEETFTPGDREKLKPLTVTCPMIVCDMHGTFPRTGRNECPECGITAMRS